MAVIEHWDTATEQEVDHLHRKMFPDSPPTSAISLVLIEAAFWPIFLFRRLCQVYRSFADAGKLDEEFQTRLLVALRRISESHWEHDELRKFTEDLIRITSTVSLEQGISALDWPLNDKMKEFVISSVVTSTISSFYFKWAQGEHRSETGRALAFAISKESHTYVK